MKHALATLRSHLQALETMAQATHPDRAGLQQQFLLAQQHFQHQILPLGDQTPSAQPIITEINRTLRLLAMDVAFLQTARQSITTQQRQRQLGDKLAQLLGFCAALAPVLNPGAIEE
ncbi:heterocyst frequency control protein PatD [Nodosilinea sp. E11]|uniref:heterocyst frequency control protein PatD n=1 Tax=Nodosilinea sp. E11 TaxID=3037479 RepID=UPI0029351A5F|nr:heterocyst frequency control protein PatD [Nodosilinea sp. E11]WOD41187.1 heterocyst frequency control protein PatD [Nodosilinea sp. E11]